MKTRSESIVYKLKKVLYGLKQALRAWYIQLDLYFTTMGLKRSNYELAVYFQISEHVHLLVSVYVDDLLVTRFPEEEVVLFK